MYTWAALIPPLILPMVIKLMTLALGMEKKTNKEKSSPFECGFDPTSKSRIPFSLQFFLLTILFLVFDIEVGLILAIPMMMKMKLTSFYFIPLLSFLLILITGLYHEWNEGSLNWKYYK